MTHDVLQFGILAQPDDFGEWANILFIVIIMVFSAIGGLIKNAESKKQQRQRQAQADRGAASRPPTNQSRQTWQQRLVRKAEEVQRAIEAKQAESEAQRRAAATRQESPDRGGLAIRTGRAGESVMVYEKDRGEPMTPRQAARQRQAGEGVTAARRAEARRRLADRQQRRETITAPPIGSQQVPTVGLGMEARSQPRVAETPSIIDYEDPDALKRAVLHYEILGKPLALRDPFEPTSSY